MDQLQMRESSHLDEATGKWKAQVKIAWAGEAITLPRSAELAAAPPASASLLCWDPAHLLESASSVPSIKAISRHVASTPDINPCDSINLSRVL
jgi:hypothetical protein